MFTEEETALMSDEEVRAAFEEMRATHRAGRLCRPEWPLADKLAAAKQAFIASAIGRPLGDDAHPLARHHLQFGGMGPMSLARAIASATGHTLGRGTALEILGMGSLESDHFPAAITEAARAAMVSRPSPLLADLQAITATVRAPNYNSVGFGAVDLDLDMPGPSTGGTEVRAIVPNMAAQKLRAHSRPWRLIVSEASLLADDVNFLPAAVGAVASAAARTEARRLAALLEGNGLPDGSPIFDAANSNVGVGALNATGLGVGFATLRKQPTESGAASGLPCAAVIVHPDDEVALLALVEDLPESRRPRVVVNPFLTDNAAWYFAADPTAAPALARVLLTGSDPSGVSISFAGSADWVDRSGKLHGIAGIALDAVHTVGLAAVSPVGIVKLTKT